MTVSFREDSTCVSLARSGPSFTPKRPGPAFDANVPNVRAVAEAGAGSLTGSFLLQALAERGRVPAVYQDKRLAHIESVEHRKNGYRLARSWKWANVEGIGRGGGHRRL